MTRRLARAALLAAMVACVAGHAPPALAGTYDVYACTNGGGSGSNNSWSRYSEYGGNTSTSGGCVSGHGLWGQIHAVSPALSQTGYYFWAPSGARITEFDVTSQADWAAGAWATQIDEYPTGGAHHVYLCPGFPAYGLPAFLNCAGNNTGWQHHIRSGLSAQNLRATVFCIGNPCGDGYVTVRWTDLRVRIFDGGAPTIAGGTGMWGTGGWVRGSQPIGFTASDNVGIRRMQIVTRPNVANHLDETRTCDYTYAVPCPGSTTASTTVDTTALDNGGNRFELWAMDSANNWGGTGKTINVDNAAPAATLRRGATEYGRTVSWSVTDAHSGVDGGSLAGAYSTDNGATWQEMTAGRWDGATFAATVPAGVADGRIKVRVSGRDNANPGGNRFTSDSATVTLDGTAPVTRLDGAGNPDVPHPGPISVMLSATDATAGMGAAPDAEPATSGAHVAYRLDSGEWTRVRGDEARIAVAGDGRHTLTYYAVDAAGNRSDERTRAIAIRAIESAPESDARFWHRTINALSTFAAAKRFGSPCPAAATLAANRDTAMVEADPDTAHGASGALDVGPQSSRRDSLVGFPLPAAPDCTVESAKLRLYALSWTGGYSGRPISASRASSSWDEPNLTWSVRPGTVGAAASATVPATAGWMEWDVTAQVQAMYRYGDNGLYLRDTGPVAPAGGLAVSFCARENTVSACGAGSARPQLVVRFSE